LNQNNNNVDVLCNNTAIPHKLLQLQLVQL